MNNIHQPPCPECVKLSKISEQSQPIGEFIDWLIENEIKLCQFDGKEYTPMYFTIEKILAEYFEIDLDKVEKEKKALLQWIREQHEA